MGCCPIRIVLGLEKADDAAVVQITLLNLQKIRAD